MTYSNGCSVTNSKAITINTNQAPTANADFYNATTNTTLNVDAAHGVLANDTDTEHDALSAVLTTANPSNGGTVTLNSDGSFVYTPPTPTFTGTDTFKYKARDTGVMTAMDDVLSDFQAGTIGGCTAVTLGNGDVMLTPVPTGNNKGMVETFSGTSVPMGWNTNGTVSVSGGSLVLNGATAQFNRTYTPQRNVEFVATFAANTPNQQVGFGTGNASTALTDSAQDWAMFSTDGTGGKFYVRTKSGLSENKEEISASYLGGPHRYRIEWSGGGHRLGLRQLAI